MTARSIKILGQTCSTGRPVRDGQGGTDEDQEQYDGFDSHSTHTWKDRVEGTKIRNSAMAPTFCAVRTDSAARALTVDAIDVRSAGVVNGDRPDRRYFPRACRIQYLPDRHTRRSIRRRKR